MVKQLGPEVKRLDTKIAAAPSKRVDPFYATTAWRALVAAIVAKRGRVCEDPHCDGRTHRAGMRVFADHVVELRDGGAALDEANILLRCGASHSLKTARERTRRVAERF